MYDTNYRLNNPTVITPDYKHMLRSISSFESNTTDDANDYVFYRVPIMGQIIAYSTKNHFDYVTCIIICTNTMYGHPSGVKRRSQQFLSLVPFLKMTTIGCPKNGGMCF